MSETDTPTSSSSVTGADPATEEIFLPGAGRATAAPAPADAPLGPAWDEDTDDEWPERGPRKGVRMSVPTVVLFALLIGAGGIWGGAALQRSHGTTSTASGASSFASLFSGRGSSSTGGTIGAGAFGAATTGTVTGVEGSTLYVTNASGTLVKVTVAPSTTVTRNAASSLASLQVGDTVVVRGSTGSNGVVTATSVAATASGVSSGFGGFGAIGSGAAAGG